MSHSNETGSPSSQSKEEVSSHESNESLLLAVRTQIEYYFSKENLATDVFLNSLMDANNSAPLAAVMKVIK